MKRIRTVNYAFLLIVLISVLLPVLLRLLLQGSMPAMTIHQNLIITEVIYVAAALLVVVALDRKLPGEIQQNLLNAKTVLLVIVFGLLVQPVSMWLNLFSQLFVTNYVTQTLSSLGDSVLFNMLYVALAPAVAEEFIFRGLIFHGYRRVGIMRAAMFSGLLFGLLHMNLNQFVYAFALGVLMALLVEATGSIYSAMIVHFMINGRSVLLLAAQQQQMRGADAAVEVTRSAIFSALLVYTPIALLCAAGMFFLIRKIAKQCGRSEYFDLVLQGQEQTVCRRRMDSAEEVRRSEEKMRAAAGELLETNGTEDAAAYDRMEGMSPAEKAERVAPQPDETYLSAGTREKILTLLPAIAAGLICIVYMFWLEIG